MHCRNKLPSGCVGPIVGAFLTLVAQLSHHPAQVHDDQLEVVMCALGVDSYELQKIVDLVARSRIPFSSDSKTTIQRFFPVSFRTSRSRVRIEQRILLRDVWQERSLLWSAVSNHEASRPKSVEIFLRKVGACRPRSSRLIGAAAPPHGSRAPPTTGRQASC